MLLMWPTNYSGDTVKVSLNCFSRLWCHGFYFD